MIRYILSEHQQGTDGWKSDRAGKATGSRAADILATIKAGEAAARRNYRAQLVAERLTGSPAENGFVSEAMKWGTATEGLARLAYESATGAIVREAGFAYLPDIQAGCSVDGFIEDGDKIGIFEAKCPLTATHINYLLNDRLPPEYEPQLLFNMWITSAAFADFVSFDPRLPDNLQLFRVRVQRDEAKLIKIGAEVIVFLQETDALLKKLQERK